MLKVYTLEESNKWDTVVRSFSEYDVYWLSGYSKGFKLHGDGEPLLFYYENRHIRGINVVFKRDISKVTFFKGKLPGNTYFDFSTPYGYGGWIIEGEGYHEWFSTLEDWCRKNGVISSFVRFHPVVKNYIFSEGIYNIIPLGQTVAMDLRSPEIIWENISSKNRNMIRKAEKSGVKIFSGRSEALYKEFIGIYNATMEHDNADDYYFFRPEFYNSICFDLPENAQIFYAVKDNEMIAASIMIAANGYLNYHLSGLKYEYRSLAPSNLLLYKAALWGCANGYKTFHLGGGVGSQEDNLFKFKKSFFKGSNLCQFYIGKKIYIQEKYDELISMREPINSGFFPEYRA